MGAPPPPPQRNRDRIPSEPAGHFAPRHLHPSGNYCLLTRRSIGNDDIVSAVVEVIKDHSNSNVTGSAGVWICGPNDVHLQLIVYDGLVGWHGNPNRDAPPVNMYGDWNPTVTETVAAPTVTSVPTETPLTKNMTWQQPLLLHRNG